MAITDLQQLLASLEPYELKGEWVFCSLAEAQSQAKPEAVNWALASFREPEGLSLVLPLAKAIELGLAYDGVFCGITLGVQSSLHAVGLTAVVAQALADAGISANVIAATYHDHVFVPRDMKDRALQILRTIRSS